MIQQLDVKPIPESTPAASDQKRPRVSIIIVNFNAGDLLTDAVRAVLDSDVRLEVIVSDNGSEDDSLEHLRALFGSDSRLEILENGENLGFAKANNRALPLTHAERLLFLNPDCIVGKDTLARMLDFMEARRDVGLASCIVRNPDGSEQAATRRSIPDPWAVMKRMLRFDPPLWTPIRLGANSRGASELPPEPIAVEAISGSFMMVDRRALMEVGALDEGYFLHWEDLDWCVRFRQAGWTIALVPDVSVIHYKGACSLRDPILIELHKHRGMERFYRKFQSPGHPAYANALVTLGIRLHFVGRALCHLMDRLLGRQHPRRPGVSPAQPPAPASKEPRESAQDTAAHAKTSHHGT